MEEKKTLTDIGFKINIPARTFLYLGLAIGVPLIFFAIVSFSLNRAYQVVMNTGLVKTVTKVNWVKLAITIVVIGVAGWILTWLLIKGITFLKNKALEKKVIDKANAEIKDTDVTLTPSELSNLADRLYSAMSGPGTDEEAVYAAFRLLRTRSDLMSLIKAFGVRKGETLPQWLTGDLSRREIEKLNAILVSNRINYSFFDGVGGRI